MTLFFIPSRIITLLLICTCFSFGQTSSWQNQTSGTTAQLRSVYFINSSVGFTCATNGIILKTTNGGTNWVPKNSGTFYTLSHIYFVNSNTGFAVGFNGTIVKTIDAGESWVPVNSFTYQNLYETFFINNNNGWIVGNRGTILKTTDGGNTWLPQSINSYNDFLAVHFVTSDIGWVCGNGSSIYKTTNGGTTWSQYYTTSAWLQSITFTDLNNGVIVGTNGIILKTSNSGVSWSTVYSDGTHFSEVVKLSNNQLLAVGESGKVVTSTDLGSTWTLQPPASNRILNAVYFTDDGTGWAVGDYGTIVKYGPWFIQNSGTTQILRDVYFINSSTGWICGATGLILKTTNGGNSWNAKTSNTNVTLTSIYFVDQNTGFCVGHSGTVLKSTNAGETWTICPVPYTRDLYEIIFWGLNTGWIAGTSGSILKTTDAGQSWIPQYGPAYDLYALHFNSAVDGWAGGNEQTIFKTSNGGQNWTSRDEGMEWIQGISFTDSVNGIIVGGRGMIARTTDKGADWNRINSPTSEHLEDVFSFGNDGSWVAGDHGLIMYSTNKGDTWQRESTPTNQWLNAIFFSDELHGWAVGNNGTILKSNYFKPKCTLKTLTVNKSGTGSGYIKVNNSTPVGQYSGAFTAGRRVTIEATPEPGSYFTGWSGDLAGTENPITLALLNSTNINANFSSDSITPSLNISGPAVLLRDQEFEIELKVNNITGLRVISFDFNYPNSYLDYISYTTGDFIPSSSSTVLPDEVSGKISTASYSLTGSGSGNGTIIKFKFRVLSNVNAGSSVQFCFENLQANDAQGNTISLNAPCSYIGVEGLLVWPGDTNNDNIVNIIDINPIIIHFNSSGPVRNSGGISWGEKYAVPWSPVQKTYADCNGNGLIEITDINAVIVNFNKNHTNSSATTNVSQSNSGMPVNKNYLQNPALSLNFLSEGEREFWVEINLGSYEKPVSNLSILSFELNYTGTEYIDYLENEIGNLMSGSTFTVIPEDENGKINLSVFNLSQSYSGYGQVCRLKFKLADSVQTSPNILFSWGLVSANRNDGSEQLVDTIGTSMQVLPVELTSFTTLYKNNQVYLNWFTASETNNKGFEIERSIDNKNWSYLTFVPGSGTLSEMKSYQYIDKPNTNGMYYYRLKQLDYNGQFKYSESVAVSVNLSPEKFSLEQNFPNPFNPSTNINYAVPDAGKVSLVVYDILGNKVAILVNENKDAGYYSVNFDAANLSSGIYFYVLMTGEQSITRKMQLLR